MDLKALKNLAPWEWPEDTGERLLAVLRDERSDESDLLLAADLAGDYSVVNDELVLALLALARDAGHSEGVRGAAAVALGPALESADLEDFDPTEPAPQAPISERTLQRAQQSLRELYRDPSAPRDVRRRALEAAVRAPQDWHRDAALAAWSSGDDAWLLTSVFCMRYLPGFARQIAEALGSRDPEVRCQALLAAGVWAVPEAAEPAAALANSPGASKRLRLAAIEAFASIRPDEAAEVLGDLCDSGDEDIAAAAQEALATAEVVQQGGDCGPMLH